MSDGGTFGGSFVYDVDTNAYSAIDITTTAGTLLPGQAYTDLGPSGTSSALNLFAVPDDSLADFNNTPVFTINVFGGLTNAGGTFTELTGLGVGETLCGTSDCTSILGVGLRFSSSGVISAVAEPGTGLLVMVGLVGLSRWRSGRVPTQHPAV